MFDEFVIQSSLKWIKEWNKVKEECMKDIEERGFAESEFVLVENDEIWSRDTGYFR